MRRLAAMAPHQNTCPIIICPIKAQFHSRSRGGVGVGWGWGVGLPPHLWCRNGTVTVVGTKGDGLQRAPAPGGREIHWCFQGSCRLPFMEAGRCETCT